MVNHAILPPALRENLNENFLIEKKEGNKKGLEPFLSVYGVGFTGMKGMGESLAQK
jgi:hypothetical protein